MPSGTGGTRRGTARGARRRWRWLRVGTGGHQYWTGRDRVFVCYCGACGWSGDVVLAARVVGHEAED